jgi:hypothetical protein
LELVSLDRETRFAFDNPPRRRERAGDLFMINARLRDGSNRPVGRLRASFAETQPPPRVVAQGSAIPDTSYSNHDRPLGRFEQQAARAGRLD